MNQPSRRGFALVELLVVIAIIGALVGLLLPAVNAARARARQAECLNNLKEIATAVVSYTTEGKQVYPGFVQTIDLDPALADEYSYVELSGKNPKDLGASWAAKLLPRLDQQGLWDQMKTTSTVDYANPPRLEVFICPDDVGTNVELAKLTYVGNTGYYDNLPNTDQKNTAGFFSDVKANGIMHDLRPGRKGPTVRTTDVKDGAGSTFLLSENVHKDEDAAGLSGFKNSWLGPVQPPTGAGPNYEQAFGMVWDIEGGASNPTQARINRDPNSPPSYGARGKGYARPASAHAEVFNVAFCGGNARSVSENIEYDVYQQLMTPNGTKADALDYNSGDERDRMLQFMTPPLSENDY